MQVVRQQFYIPEKIAVEVSARLDALARAGEPVDYLTVVPDGEPTLDLRLEALLAALKPLGIPLAVITNASLLSDPSVRSALLLADWVSLKVDAVADLIWRRVDRPHGRLLLPAILDGAREFARSFEGALATETMLVAGVNDAPETLAETADFIATLHPRAAYLGIPTRPPAELWVRAPEAAVLNQAYQLYVARLPRVEYLIGYEGNVFAATGDAAADLLSITSVHPLRDDAVAGVLARCGAAWTVVTDLVAAGALAAIPYDHHIFYLRGYFAHERSFKRSNFCACA